MTDIAKFKPSTIYTIYIASTPAKVFEALTSADGIQQPLVFEFAEGSSAAQAPQQILVQGEVLTDSSWTAQTLYRTNPTGWLNVAFDGSGSWRASLDNMQQPEGSLGAGRQAAPVGPDRLQQVEGSHDVGLDEFARSMDGAVDMRFGRKIDDGTGLVLRQQAVDQRRVAEISVDKHMPRIAIQRGEVLPVAGIGELVQVDDRLAGAGQPVQHEVAADEAGTAGNEDCHAVRVLGNG